MYFTKFDYLQACTLTKVIHSCFTSCAFSSLTFTFCLLQHRMLHLTICASS